MGGTSTISGGKLCLRIDPRVPTLSGCAASRGPTIKANTVPFSWIMASIHEGLVKDWQRTQLAGYISKSLQIMRLSCSERPNGAFASGDFTDAEAIAHAGMELADALGDQFGSDQCRVGLVSVHAFRGDVLVAVDMVRDLIVRAERAGDLMSKVIGLFEQTYVLAYRGDGTGARAAGVATIEAASECPGFLERGIHSAVTAACLADGDPAAAWEAALAMERVGIVIRGVDDLHMVWTAQAALAHGEVEVARRRADVAVSASNGCWLATALST
ncbi:MAG: hypothetical protein QOD88_3710, partial [Mycobacterium sp.]|nr:hypothetical protein [Mycobacterium sp.]